MTDETPRFHVFSLDEGGGDPVELCQVDSLDEARWHATLDAALAGGNGRRVLICDTEARTDAKRWFSVDGKVTTLRADSGRFVKVQLVEPLAEQPFTRPKPVEPPADEYEAHERRGRFGQALVDSLHGAGLLQKFKG